MFNPISTMRDLQQRVLDAATPTRTRSQTAPARSSRLSRRQSGTSHRGQDAVTLSPQARRAASFRSLGNTVSSGITRQTNRTSNGIQSVADLGGQVLGALSGLPGRAHSAGARLATRGVSSGLQFFGRDREARAVRRQGDSYSRTIDRVREQSETQVGNFVSGVGDGVADIVEDAGVIAANPGRALRNVNRMANAVNPASQVARSVISGRSLVEVHRDDARFLGQVGDSFVEQYRQTQRDHGTAGATGRIVFDVISTIGTGGTTTAVRGGGRVAATAATRASGRTASGITSDFLGVAVDLTAPITEAQLNQAR